MKAGLLMSLESTSARCEQMAQHMLIHGTPFDPPTIWSAASTRSTTPRSAASSRAGATAPPTLVALGPVGELEDFARLQARLGV